MHVWFSKGGMVVGDTVDDGSGIVTDGEIWVGCFEE